MSDEGEQRLLLKIIGTWQPNNNPEYRGFRCGICQKYINKGWHHWLYSDNYLLPIHICIDCEPNLDIENITLAHRKVIKKGSIINNNIFKETAIRRLTEIIKSWRLYKKPKLKIFSCDECGKDLFLEKFPNGTKQRKGYHVWWKSNKSIISELHFHKKCGNKLKIVP